MPEDQQHPTQSDQAFSPREVLYYRVSLEDVEGTAILPTALNLPNISHSRGKYSHPQEVIGHQMGARPSQNGIAQIQVDSIPAEIFKAKEGTVSYALRLIHDPILLNYAHTEIRVNRTTDSTGAKLKKEPSSAEVSKKIRECIVEAMFLIHPPSIPPAEGESEGEQLL